MKTHLGNLIAIALILAVGSRSYADSVLLLGAGVDYNTLAAKSALLAAGHTSVTIGAAITSFTGGLSGYNAVVLLDGDQTGIGYNMPVSGQNALLSFLNSGGGLVTSEWSIWGNADGGFSPLLAAAFPVVPHTGFDYLSPLTYTQSTANAVLDNGVASSFTFNADDSGGTETYFQPKGGATVYFASSGGLSPNGLIGWNYGSGRVISFSTLVASDDDQELANSNYAKLFSNSVYWSEDATPSSVPLPSPLFGGLTLMAAAALYKRVRRLA